MTQASEVQEIHTQIMKCDLIPEESRAYWQHHDPQDTKEEAQLAYDNYWFGSCNLKRVRLLLNNLRLRFDAYPFTLPVLKRWHDMTTEERLVICHWHLQLSDPMYRDLTGEVFPERYIFDPPHISREFVIRWIEDLSGDRWANSSRKQIASKLLSCAHYAGLTARQKDPRPLRYPQVSKRALTYLLYTRREVEFEGELWDNPYLLSVGLGGRLLERQLKHCDAIRFQRMGNLRDFGWRYPDLQTWAEAEWPEESS